MSHTILRWVLREWDDIEESIVSFLRDHELNNEVTDFLSTFNSTVVAYAPTLEEITLQDLIVAYQDGKLSEWQMNSIEWFINYSSQYLEIRLWVISSINRDTSIPVSDLTDIERKVIQEALKDRFKWLSISDFSWTFHGTTQVTDRKIITINPDDLEVESWNRVQDGIKAFIEKIKTNIYAKRQPSVVDRSEKSEESEVYIDGYIEKLLDTDIPLDKALLKTVPLDLSFQQQKEVITRLIKRLFPEICDSVKMDFIANSLDVFPDIWGKNGKRTRQSRGFKFWKSISESYLKQILEQELEIRWKDKFMTTALRRIIVPLRFLILKSKTDKQFLAKNDDEINILPQYRLEEVLSEIWLDEIESATDLESLTNLFLSIGQTERREFIKRVTAVIVGVSYEKIDFTHIDYVIEKYVWSISEYSRAFISPVSQLLKADDTAPISQEKIRELIYALSCLRRVKELDIQAEIAYKWDLIESEDDLKTYEEAHTATAEQESIISARAETESSIDSSDTQELDFYIDMCREFESNNDQYSEDVDTMIENFLEFDSNQKIYVFGVLWIKVDWDEWKQEELLKEYLHERYLENANLCTNMIYRYQDLMKTKRRLDESVKIIEIDRILQRYSELNSQDQEEFLDKVWITHEEGQDLSDTLYERVFWRNKKTKNHSSTTIFKNKDELISFFEGKKRQLRVWSINNTDLNTISSAFEAFTIEEKLGLLDYCLIGLFDFQKMLKDIRLTTLIPTVPKWLETPRAMKQILWRSCTKDIKFLTNYILELVTISETEAVLSKRNKKTISLLFTSKIKRSK